MEALYFAIKKQKMYVLCFTSIIRSPAEFLQRRQCCSLSICRCPSTIHARRARPLTKFYCSIRIIDDSESEPRPVQISPTGTVESAGESEFLENCETCGNTGFVECHKCKGSGMIRNPRSVNVFYCPVCVGHKKVRCPSCGGKCYMCE